MTDDEALEIVVSATRVERYRWLCSDENRHPPPDSAEDYRRLVREMAARAAYPHPLEQAGNLARSLWDWAVDGFKVASPELQGRRRATCAACPRWVPADRRCILCGCYTEAKVTLKAESCPEGRW